MKIQWVHSSYELTSLHLSVINGVYIITEYWHSNSVIFYKFTLLFQEHFLENNAPIEEDIT
jgi:hypothetical protein